MVVAARVTLDRAPRFGPRRGRVGGVEGRRGAAAGRRPGRARPGLADTVGGRSRCRSPRSQASASVGRAVPRLRRARVRSRPPAATRCFASWCWRGSSSRPARSTRCGCSTRPAWPPPSYPTLKRRLPVFAKPAFRQALSAACAAHAGLGPASPGALRRVDAVLRDRCR